MLAVDASLERGSFRLDAALEVEGASPLALLGPSGSGKTTLLRIIAGLTAPDRGRIALDGEVWVDVDAGLARPVEERRVGFLFQDYALFPHMSAWRNVAYAIRDGGRSERRARAHELLERFDVLDRSEAPPSRLSGGERQRVALARALAVEPCLLLLDEPLSALDARTRAAASGQLAGLLRAAEVPAVIVTHDFAEAALLADRVAVLDGGRIVQRGKPAELAASPASPFVADLTGAVVLRGVALPGPEGLSRIELDGGGIVLSTDRARGRVAVSVFPWEISLGAAGSPPEGSSLNHLSAEVASITEFGNRARVGLRCPQPLVAEVTSASIARLGLAPGSRVAASWKATATRVTPL